MVVAIATHVVVAGNRAWDDVSANIGCDHNASHISLRQAVYRRRSVAGWKAIDSVVVVLRGVVFSCYSIDSNDYGGGIIRCW